MKVLLSPGLFTVGSHKYLLKLLPLSQHLLLIAVEFAVLFDTCITVFYVWIKGTPTSENQMCLNFRCLLLGIITQSYLCYEVNVI